MKGTHSIAAWSVIDPGEMPDVSFSPPIMRRRLSPLQKLFFALAHSVESSAPATTVFASRDGEDLLTRRIVDEFHADGTVSPQRFSSSVYNAAPGLWSVLTRNRAPYTAIAAGEDTIECGLLELFMHGAQSPATLVYAEETGGGYGFALALGAATGARLFDVSVGDASRPAITFSDAKAFLSGESRELAGRWLTLRSA
jgi:hypothetical protein